MSFSDFIALLNTKACQQAYGYIGKHKPLDPSKPTYLTVNLECAYIPYVRKGIDKFYATLYGNISLSPDADAKNSFQVIDTLSSLPEIKELDARHLDRIALGPHRLLDDVPYRFEGLHVNLCLFSVQSGNLAGPYIDLLKSIANAAGISFLSQAAPLADVIQKGITNLVGPNELEIGRCGMFDPVETGYYVVVRTDKTSLALNELEFDPESRKLMRSGQPLTDFPYFVLRFLQSDKRENWSRIPKINEALYAMRDQFTRTPKEYSINQKLFDLFECAVMLTPDLLEDDAAAIVRYMRDKSRIFLSAPEKSAKTVVDVKPGSENQPVVLSADASRLYEPLDSPISMAYETPEQSLNEINQLLWDDK